MILGLYMRIAGLRMVSLIFAAAFVILLPGLLSPEEYGRFNLALSLTQVGVAILLSWPNQALLRFGREEFVARNSLGAVTASRLLLHAVLLLPAMVLSVLAADHLATWAGLDPDMLLLTFLVGLPILSLSDMTTFLAQATGRFSGYGFAPVALRSFQLAALVGIALGLAAEWSTLMWATLAGYSLGMAMMIRTLPAGAMTGFRPSLSILRRLLAYSRLMPLTSASAFVLSWMDLWFLNSMMGRQEVGIYAWAYSVTLMAMTLLVPLSAILAPRAIDDRLARDSRAQTALVGAVGGGIVLLAGLLTIAVGLIPFFASALTLGEYESAITPLTLLTAGILFQFGMSTIEPSIYADEALVPAMTGVTLSMVAVNAIVDVALIPILGVAGPALGTVSAYGTGMILVWRLLARRKHKGASLLPYVTVASVVVAIAGATTLLSPLSAALLGIAGGSAIFWVGRRTGLMAGLIPATLTCPPKLRCVLQLLCGKEPA